MRGRKKSQVEDVSLRTLEVEKTPYSSSWVGIGNKKLLTATEERELIARYRLGDPEAKRELVEANLRLVLSIARRFNAKSLSFEDLVQEGAIGLQHALDKYNPDRGRVSTYATYWIRQAIVRALEREDRLVRLPTYAYHAAGKLLKMMEAGKETGIYPTLEEMTAHTGVTTKLIPFLLSAIQDPLSLDMVVGDQEDTTLGELIVDEIALTPHERAEKTLERERIDGWLAQLGDRERTVIELRFGLRDGRRWTLKEVAELLGLSREGVRHVETRAKKQIKAVAGGTT